MTCREKLAQDHPAWRRDYFEKYINNHCPDEFGYADDPDYCIGSDNLGDCTRCWDREISEKGCEAKVEPIIKDSGNRREFDSGAVRDMQEGKGRCDLFPMEVAADILHSPVLSNIASFQKSKLTRFLFAALEQFAIERYADETNENETCTKVYCDMLLEVAKHFEDGAKKYGPDNWRRGIPEWCYIDSATRHYLKWKRGDKDEYHDRAFCWNLMCCIWEVDHHVKDNND